MIWNGNGGMATIPGFNQIQFESFCRFITKGLREEFEKFPKEKIEDINKNLEFLLFAQIIEILGLPPLGPPLLGFEGIIRIQIEKQGVRAKKTFVRVIIYSGLVPKFLLKGETLKDLKENIEKQEFFYSIYPTRYPRRLRLQLVEYAEEPLYSHPNLIAEFIALQIKQRVPFRKTMKKAIDITKSTGIKGIKIQLAGRKDIARKESKRKGKLPLQIICTKIDYYSHKIQAVYGVLGLKIWIFRN